MALSGDLAGVWVCEFLNAWREVYSSPGGRTISVDLTEVQRVDKAGEYVLALIRCNGSKLRGSGLVIGNLVETIVSDWPVTSVDSAPSTQAQEA